MRTYQKLRIESRIRSGSGVAITSKPHGDVVAQVPEHAQNPARRRGDPVHAQTNSTPRECGSRTRDPRDEAHGTNDQEAQHAARVFAETLPRLRQAFAREQPAAAAQLP